MWDGIERNIWFHEMCFLQQQIEVMKQESELSLTSDPPPPRAYFIGGPAVISWRSRCANTLRESPIKANTNFCTEYKRYNSWRFGFKPKAKKVVDDPTLEG